MVVRVDGDGHRRTSMASAGWRTDRDRWSAGVGRAGDLEREFCGAPNGFEEYKDRN